MSNINDFIIENGVLKKYIGKDSEVIIPDSVRSIGDFAFLWCCSLKSVVIPNSVTSIGRNAFDGCTSLTSVIISDSVRIIGMGLFAGCTALKYNEYDNAYYLGNEDNPYVVLVNAKSNEITSCKIHCDTKIISPYAFGYCGLLTSIEFSESLMSIGDSAFCACHALQYNEYDNAYYLGNEGNPYVVLVKAKDSEITSCKIHHNTKIISYSAFDYCTSLTNIAIPDSVTSIGSSAFAYCRSLTGITISGFVENIADDSFNSCKSFTRIEVEEHNANYRSIEGILYDKEVKRLIQYATAKKDKTFIVPDTVTTIVESAFSYCDSLENLIIPDSVISVGENAFHACSSLVNLTIGDSLINIGEDAFSHCKSLAKISVLSENLDSYALKMISELNSLTILVAPKIPFETLKKRGLALAAATGYLLNMEKFNNHPEEEQYKKYVISQRRKILPEVFKEDLVECLRFYEQLGAITKKNVDEEFLNPAQEANAINCVAFVMDWKNKNISQKDIEKQFEKELTKDPFNTTDMKKLWTFKTLEDGTLEIKSYKGNDTVVSIPERIGNKRVTGISDFAFDAFIGYKTTTKEKLNILQNINKIIIPDSVTSIGRGAFSGCTSLTDIDIPDSVEKVAGSAFQNCTALKYNKYDNGCYLGNESNPYTILVKVKNKKNKSCQIHKDTRVILTNAFNDCTSLTSIDIPESVVHIGANTFIDCRSLTNVTIPISVISIDSNVFCNCKALTSVNIPNLVSIVSERTFENCVSLANIRIPISVTKIERSAFAYCISLKDVYYAGSAEEWEKITIGENNYNLINATIHFEK